MKETTVTDTYQLLIKNALIHLTNARYCITTGDDEIEILEHLDKAVDELKSLRSSIDLPF